MAQLPGALEQVVARPLADVLHGLEYADGDNFAYGRMYWLWCVASVKASSVLQNSSVIKRGDVHEVSRCGECQITA